MNKVKELAATVRGAAETSLAEIVSEGTQQAQNYVRERVAKMADTVHAREGGKTMGNNEGFEGVSENEVLTFVPDRRTISGVAPALMGIFLLVVLPGGWKVLSIVFFIAAFISAVFGYVWQSKVDIPEGFTGVVCTKGRPDGALKAHTGRNWNFNFIQFIPFLVASNRDQVVTIQVANFTKDFASVAMRMVIVFRITDAAKFAVNTSPAVAMRLMQAYARYIALRMITSIDDARVKFTGRDNLMNIAKELNRYLGEYGITVIRVSMPEAENGILEDLEHIRIVVNEAASLRQQKAMRLEAGVKAIEAEVRKSRKNALALAQELRNEGISFGSAVSVAANGERQRLVIETQRDITTKYSILRGAIAELAAKIDKAKAMQESIAGLQLRFDLQLAKLKREVRMKLLPKRISVLHVDGIGNGVGLSFGRDIFRETMKGSDDTPETTTS